MAANGNATAKIEVGVEGVLLAGHVDGSELTGRGSRVAANDAEEPKVPRVHFRLLEIFESVGGRL